LRDFYNLEDGGDISTGYDINPVTQMPYAPQMVKRGDYGRILAEFWADGPDSETPPGHWYTILNYVTDNMTEKQFNGQGPDLSDLEFDVKAYFTLGGAMHDVAITAWGIKGWYDYVRPVSAIRYMADKGQSSDETLPSYHPAGIHLIPGFVELVAEGDTIAGDNNEHVDKIKLLAWKGPDYIEDPELDIAHVGWILAEDWWPYQRPSFVTPNFAGYISGHSTYSRAAAEVLTELTGSEYFPGGMGEFEAPANDFLVFEVGPSEDITLQWATYQDASDQCSLSRIWGGIHPPADDIPGRLIGDTIGNDAYNLAKTYFYKDEDQDGFVSFEDCDDMDNTIYPGAPELCDGKDNDCNGEIDDAIEVYTYYLDADSDGFGNAAISVDTCQSTPLEGYVINMLDCDDSNELINPDGIEICNGLDNNCNGIIGDGLDVFTYYLDADSDGFGDPNTAKDTCQSTVITGYTIDNTDCDDTDPAINPNADDIANNGIDEDCDGADFVSSVKELTAADVSVFPNPVTTLLQIHTQAFTSCNWRMLDVTGRTLKTGELRLEGGESTIDVSGLQKGLHILILENEEERFVTRVVKF
ncbi:MAG: MopE-related protein, partial [Saprospiraceae bacterium]